MELNSRILKLIILKINVCENEKLFVLIKLNGFLNL